MIAELEDLLGAYWDLAYEEGRTRIVTGKQIGRAHV